MGEKPTATEDEQLESQRTVKSSKSNSSERVADPGDQEEEDAGDSSRTSNLNLSKSNINRAASPGGGAESEANTK